MSLGNIWWEQLGCSLRLLNQLTNHLLDCRSAVLQAGQGLPWRRIFMEELNLRRSSFSGDRRMVQLDWDGQMEPGESVLRNLCSQEVCIQYWPGISYAQYLASLEDIMLHDYYVWVSNIHTEAEVQQWWDFVSAYESRRTSTLRRAVFILEYDGPEIGGAGPVVIPFRIENHNCRVFCLEAASALGNTGLVDYQAELALCIGGQDPEFCAALLNMGEALLLDPVHTALDVIECDRSSAGTPFPEKTELEITSAVWKSALMLLFPILEEYRMAFIDKYRADLVRHLPYHTSFGAIIREAEDLELGHLWNIISNNSRHIAPEDYQTVKVFRQVRHRIAHIDTVPLGEVQAVLTRK